MFPAYAGELTIIIAAAAARKKFFMFVVFAFGLYQKPLAGYRVWWKKNCVFIVHWDEHGLIDCYEQWSPNPLINITVSHQMST